MEPKELRTLMCVDLSTSTLFQISQASNKALLMLDLIGNIGLTRANVRDPVGLLGFSDQIELFVKPKLGTSQVFYIAKQIFEKMELAREYPQKRAAKFSLPLLFMASRLKMPALRHLPLGRRRPRQRRRRDRLQAAPPGGGEARYDDAHPG